MNILSTTRGHLWMIRLCHKYTHFKTLVAYETTLKPTKPVQTKTKKTQHTCTHKRQPQFSKRQSLWYCPCWKSTQSLDVLVLPTLLSNWSIPVSTTVPNRNDKQTMKILNCINAYWQIPVLHSSMQHQLASSSCSTKAGPKKPVSKQTILKHFLERKNVRRTDHLQTNYTGERATRLEQERRKKSGIK